MEEFSKLSSPVNLLSALRNRGMPLGQPSLHSPCVITTVRSDRMCDQQYDEQCDDLRTWPHAQDAIGCNIRPHIVRPGVGQESIKRNLHSLCLYNFVCALL